MALQMINGKWLHKYPKQSYGSCAWHVVWMCFTNVWSFVEIYLTVIKLQSGHKNSIAYDQRGIAPKIFKAELWFLCITRRLNVFYKCMKLRQNISYSFQVIELTQFCDRQTQGKNNMTAFNLHIHEILNKMTNSTYGYNVLDKY